MMRCTIWYHLYNLKIVRNTYGEALLLVLQVKPATLLKVTPYMDVFYVFKL